MAWLLIIKMYICLLDNKFLYEKHFNKCGTNWETRSLPERVNWFPTPIKKRESVRVLIIIIINVMSVT